MPNNVMLADGGVTTASVPVAPVPAPPAAIIPNSGGPPDDNRTAPVALATIDQTPYVPPPAPVAPPVDNTPPPQAPVTQTPVVPVAVPAASPPAAVPPTVTDPAPVPQPPATTPPTDAGTGGQAGFDFNAAISGDPGYLALLASIQAANSTDQANLARGTSSALINFGAVPSNLPGSLPISASDAALAAQNPYSTEAQLSRAHDMQVRQFQNQLAARGGFNSGELSYAFQQEGLRYGGAQAKATAVLVDYLNNLQANYATAQANRELDKANGIAAAYNRAIALYAGNIGTGQTPAAATAPTIASPADALNATSYTGAVPVPIAVGPDAPLAAAPVDTSSVVGGGGTDTTVAPATQQVDTTTTSADTAQAPVAAPVYTTPQEAVAGGVPPALSYAAAGLDPSKYRVSPGVAYAS